MSLAQSGQRAIANRQKADVLAANMSASLASDSRAMQYAFFEIQTTKRIERRTKYVNKLWYIHKK